MREKERRRKRTRNKRKRRRKRNTRKRERRKRKRRERKRRRRRKERVVEVIPPAVIAAATAAATPTVINFDLICQITFYIIPLTHFDFIHQFDSQPIIGYQVCIKHPFHISIVSNTSASK